MSKIPKLILCLILVMFMSISAAASDEVNVIINGEQLHSDVPAQIISGRTMVPMRAVFEALNADISWDNTAKKITANKNDIKIEMTVGETKFYKNNILNTLDVPAQIIDGRTLVPVRVVSESLGCDVDWNNDSKTVVITDNAQTAKDYHFRNEKLLNEHFEKHGGEFDYSSAAEYETAASKVINDVRALHKLEKEDGDDVYYIEETNEFVILSSDGYIRTYFKPNSGIKYYEKQ